MSSCLFEHPEFDHHQRVVFCHDQSSGLRALIAIHDTTLGPALGGCRMFNYRSEVEAVHDVLRLSRGMTYKAALAGLPLGGGKSVIMADPKRDKGADLFAAMGRCVEELNGSYIVAQDSGIGVDDLLQMGHHTQHVSGIHNAIDDAGRTRSGDPSPATAYGVFIGIQAALAHQRGSGELKDVKVAVQGAGSVGRNLIKHLLEAGAQVSVSDVSADNLQQAQQLGAIQVLPVDKILTAEVDVLAPCAMGGAITLALLDQLKAGIIAGAANNQLQSSEVGRALQQQNVLYAPDYVINAGGLMHLHTLDQGLSWHEAEQKVSQIAQTLTQIFSRAEQTSQPTALVADEWALQTLQDKRRSEAQTGATHPPAVSPMTP